MKKTIGLCFSGGSVKGYAHLGVYQALLDLGIAVDMFSGASVGGLMAVFVADGWIGREIFDLLEPRVLKKLFTPTLSHHALLSHRALKQFLAKHLSVDSLELLQKPCYIQTSNIQKGQGVCRSAGIISDIVTASISIPGVFKPVLLDGDYHMDGGISDNFPVSMLQNHVDIILGSSLASLLEQKKTGIKSIMQQSFLMLSRSSITLQYASCNIVFEPLSKEKVNILAIRSFTKQQSEYLYQLGYESVMNKIGELRDLGLVK